MSPRRKRPKSAANLAKWSFRVSRILLCFKTCEPAPCVRPSMRARAVSALVACAVRPAGHTAWTTWCRSWKVGAIRTATWFPVAWDATRRKGATRPRIFCVSFSATDACRPKTSAHACSPRKRSRQASSALPFLAERTQEAREAQRIKGQGKALRPEGPRHCPDVPLKTADLWSILPVHTDP